MESYSRYNIENDSRDYENFIEQNLDAIIEKYHKAEQKYRNLYDNSLDLLRTINLQGIITDCNKTYINTLGYTREETVGASIFEHVAEESLETLQDAFKTWKSNGIVRDRKIWLKKKDGQKFPTLLSATNLYDRTGNLIGSNTTIRDISEIYIAREETEQQKIKRISDIGVLSARIAHDLKNPLSVIKNSIELLKMRTTSLDDRTKKDYERIERATVRIAHQIDEVLEYVWPKPLEFSDSSLLDIFQTVISKINVQQVAIDLPRTDVNILCDASKLEIVFSNLILNAIQAMNGMGNIHIRTKNEEKTTIIEVEDTGHGIPQDLLPRIFEPLFTTRQIGTGLGLVSCKNIIEKHGGSIEIKTQMDKGTTFIINLPKIRINGLNLQK
ncbi:MAG TPA: ATP-binding protein [Candidatus Nitrosotalea sp.]|nr:PAS domain S-box protein [Nitrososphaerota archaeon]HKU32505.1 ATP-binding protein [Candidatus Nitrosotalea sp.]